MATRSEAAGTAIVSLDSYYGGMEEIPLPERNKVNFDHPDDLDWELLHEHLQAVAAGRAFEEPVHSFADYASTAETRRIEPAEFLIVEGLFVLYWPELRACWTRGCTSRPSPAPASRGDRRATWRSAAAHRNRRRTGGRRDFSVKVNPAGGLDAPALLRWRVIPVPEIRAQAGDAEAFRRDDFDLQRMVPAVSDLVLGGVAENISVAQLDADFGGDIGQFR